MVYFALWYLFVSILGLITFPLAFRLLPALGDRGYTASRVLGALLWGYSFWLLASLGVLHNTTGGLLFALALLIALSVWSARRISMGELREWWMTNRRMVLISEILFLLAFGGWTIVRAANPEALGTEKPMELAFINAILNSPTFPPHDPWLSGYAISYYYFGYVIIGMLAWITGTPGAIAFNLGTSLTFGLSAIITYGLVYNLLKASTRQNISSATQSLYAAITALLGPLYVLIISNWEGFLHSLHNQGLFWTQAADGKLISRFWQWLDIKDLNMPPQTPFSWMPTRFWWWWRASRVIQDYDLAGAPKEIINEFPFFSYLLADLHPHVLAMPFAFLAMALALNLLLGGGRGELSWFHRRINLRTLSWIGIGAVPLGIFLISVGVKGSSLSSIGLGILTLIMGAGILFKILHAFSEFGLATLVHSNRGELLVGPLLQLNPETLLLSALALGGMGFLNTWDFPVYVALFAGAYALFVVKDQPKKLSEALPDFLWMGLTMGILGGLFYLPFYLGFSSQAGGPLPNLIYPTRGAHLWVMFAPLLLPVFAFLLYLVSLRSDRKNLVKGFKLVLGLTLLLWILSLLLGFAITILPELGQLYLSTLGAFSSVDAFVASFARRIISPGGWLTLFILLVLTFSVFLWLDHTPTKEASDDDEADKIPPPPEPPPHPTPPLLINSHLFALLLILTGAFLVFGLEFFYLRDLFGWRINSIFKFYFQAWLLWGIAAAYASGLLINVLKRAWGLAFSLGLVLIIGISLIYPLFSLISKTNGFQPSQWTLDSSAYMENQAPDELAAVRWLQSASPGIITEAVPAGGGSYTGSARISTLSGQPAVLGWVGHESQWRGGGQAAGSRQYDLERLYCSRNWEEARSILEQYNIRYIIVSELERTTYQSNENTCPTGLVNSIFLRYLTPVFQQGQVTIYEYTGTGND